MDDKGMTADRIGWYNDAPRLAYRINEAAKLAGISSVTIYRLIAKGKLKTVKVGRCRLVPTSALRTLIERGAP
jgi:excisionase family DNA binding protein